MQALVISERTLEPLFLLSFLLLLFVFVYLFFFPCCFFEVDSVPFPRFECWPDLSAPLLPLWTQPHPFIKTLPSADPLFPNPRAQRRAAGPSAETPGSGSLSYPSTLDSLHPAFSIKGPKAWTHFLLNLRPQFVADWHAPYARKLLQAYQAS